MKKSFFPLLLLFGALDVFGQNNGCISAEFVTDYYYYIIGRNMTNDFNYGFSMLVSDKVRNVKVSMGVGYSTKLLQAQTNFGDLTYDLKSIHFPILATVNFISWSSDISGGVLAGAVFNQILDYKINHQSQDGVPFTESGLLNNREMGISLMIGVAFSKRIGNKCVINLTPFMKYNLVDDHGSQSPDYRNIPDDKVSVGCRLAVELLLIK
ncbi:MAG: hypothetical protein IJ524_04045 [Bacteroidales bacterium]|nr:hypothetical protein [Bacteroidales bacterium]